MTPRQLRRAAERQQRKADRKAGFPNDNSSNPTPPPTPADPVVTAPGPPPAAISAACLAANIANSKLSTGPSPAGIAASCQNHTIHGLARHSNGTFRLLTSEDPLGFEALKQSLAIEHSPITPTETILVNSMAESHWLSQRAQRLQDTRIDPNTGELKDEKKASLYLRYQTTHTRAFHKSLNDLIKLRAEKHKAEFGFEAQKAKLETQQAAEQRQNERHEMKKRANEADLFIKDLKAHNNLSDLTFQNMKNEAAMPGFTARYEAELEKEASTRSKRMSKRRSKPKPPNTRMHYTTRCALYVSLAGSASRS